MKGRVRSANEERDQLLNERQELFKRRAKLELAVKDLQEEVNGDMDAKSRIGDQLEKLDSTIQQKQTELESIMPRYEELKKEEERCTARLQVCEQRRTELFAKQGRGNQFTTRDDRDKWIRKELKSLNKAIKDKDEQVGLLFSTIFH